MSNANVFAISSLTGLTEDEWQMVNKMLARLAVCGHKNLHKERYYEGEQRVRDLGIAIPPSLKDVETVVGWPTTTVDVLEERINLEGFGQATDTDEAGIGQIVSDNQLLTEFPLAVIDSLIYGVAFLAVGSGAAGEPDPLITVESPMHTTGEYSQRARRLVAGLTQECDKATGQPTAVTLYLPDQTVIAQRSVGEARWRVQSRDEHRLGRVPVVRLVNRPRSSDRHGRSEITRAVRSYTDNAVRTLLGMEVAREFYAAPQRYVLGAPEAAFVGADGRPKAAWESYLGKFLALDAGENDDGTQRKLEVGQFDAAPMTPYGTQMQLLSQLLAAEVGFPASYLGFTTENPASADAIRAGEARLIKRAERRITNLGAGGVEVIEIACRIRDKAWPAPGIYAQFGDPATPTKGATTDAIIKQIQAGAIPARNDLTLEKLGYTKAERDRLLAAPDTGELDRVINELRAGQTPVVAPA